MTSWKTSRKILHTVRTSTSTKVGLLVFIMGPFGRKPAIKLRTEWCLSSHPVWTCYSRMERKSDKEFLQMWLLCVHVSLSKCDWTCHMRSEVKSSTSGFQWQMGMNGSVKSAVILVLQLMLLLLQLCQPEGQHPLTGQRAANFRLLANQWAERRLVTQWRHGCHTMRRSVCNAGASNAGRSLCVQI